MRANYTNKDVYGTLENIIAFHMFATSPRAQDFLKYIVTETLEGRAKTLNGTTIGQDVFEKGADFDPIQDSVVRVYARRLRFMLRDYYLEHPDRDPVIITVPKGGYKPLIEKNIYHEINQKTSEPTLYSPKENATKLIALAVATIALITASFFGISKLMEKKPTTSSPLAQTQFSHLISSYPMIAVAPFKNETGEEDYDFLEEALQKKMVEDLSRFRLIRPLVYKSPYETLLTEKNVPYGYAFSGLILSVKPELDLYIKLVDIEASSLVYESRIRRSNNNSDYFDSLSEIVSELSGNFAGLEGAIVENNLEVIEKHIEADTLRVTNLEAFECFGLVGKLLENPNPALYARIHTCLRTLLKAEPNNSTLLSAYGWITYVGATSYEPVLMARSIQPDINAEDGVLMMERAVEIDPNDAWAQQTLSSYKSMLGDLQGALKHAEMAVIANPGDPDNLTSLSLRLANVGHWERALALAQEALDRNPKPSSHYYHPFFLWALNNDDAAALADTASKITNLEDYYADIYGYLAAVANNDEALIAELQPAINTIAGRNDDNIMSVAGVLIESDVLQEKARVLFMKGGALPPDLDDVVTPQD